MMLIIIEETDCKLSQSGHCWKWKGYDCRGKWTLMETEGKDCSVEWVIMELEQSVQRKKMGIDGRSRE